MGTEVFPLLLTLLKIVAGLAVFWGMVAAIAWLKTYQTAKTNPQDAVNVREHITRSIIVVIAGIALYLLLSIFPIIFQLLF
jgi:hypothetical protein